MNFVCGWDFGLLFVSLCCELVVSVCCFCFLDVLLVDLWCSESVGLVLILGCGCVCLIAVLGLCLRLFGVMFCLCACWWVSEHCFRLLRLIVVVGFLMLFGFVVFGMRFCVHWAFRCDYV